MRWHIAATVLFLGCSHAAPAPPPAAQRSANGDWIERSNRNAQDLLDVRARITPELAARTGVVGIVERISDFTPGHLVRLLPVQPVVVLTSAYPWAGSLAS